MFDFPHMFDFTAKDWITHLESWYSFDQDLWSQNPCDPYYRAMQRFQVFTNRIIANLRRDDDTPMQHGQLQKIYDGLPCFHEQTAFHEWVKDATMKHPQRRTAKQFQWLYIVELQEVMPTGHIEVMAERAILSLKLWEDDAFNVHNLSNDPFDKGYFFRKKHAVTNVTKDYPSVGESCWICANDFDIDLHRPQQGPCGHIYCHDCFKKTLAQALRPSQPRYTCAFCRSCLVCGVSSCEDHVFADVKVSPYPLVPSLHLLCVDHCVANENEELCGISPMRYWEFREQSRELRMILHVQVYQRDLAVDPVHLKRAEEEVQQSIVKLKEMAVQAHKLTQEDAQEEMDKAWSITAPLEDVTSLFVEDDPSD